MKTKTGIDLLRDVLLRMRDDDQVGFCSYLGSGKWGFIETRLPYVTGDELNALLDLVGVVPDRVVPLGSCKTCRFSKDGQTRGWQSPCVFCAMPKHSLWEGKK